MARRWQVQKGVILWLMMLSMVLWLMIMLGGYTRLTHAGLSIVDWKPFTGIIPPMTKADWMAAFQEYQQFPEFKTVNASMTLEGFKEIYLIEYFHRALGRLIGVLLLVPFLYFWIKKSLPSFLKGRLLFVFLLGGLQGLMGWYMVQSGLIDQPEVSHLRLTAHLVLAIWILAIVLWSLFQLTEPEYKESIQSLTPRRLTSTAMISITLTIIYGGFVAGLKAGLIYNTYPLMGEHFLPEEWAFFTPLSKNFIENPVLIQFIHRWLGISTLILVIFTSFSTLKYAQSKRLRMTALLFSSTAFFQVTLGILTLLNQVPVGLGTLHQGTAVVLFAIGLYLLYQLRDGKETYSVGFPFLPQGFPRQPLRKHR